MVLLCWTGTGSFLHGYVNILCYIVTLTDQNRHNLNDPRPQRPRSGNPTLKAIQNHQSLRSLRHPILPANFTFPKLTEPHINYLRSHRMGPAARAMGCELSERELLWREESLQVYG